MNTQKQKIIGSYLLPNYVLIALILLSCSCKTTYVSVDRSHQEVMGSYKNKDQVINDFGLPTTKKQEGEYEEWHYDYGSKTVTNYANTSNGRLYGEQGAVIDNNGYYGTGKAATSNTTRGQVVNQTYTSYAKFVFKDDKTVRWSSNGIDKGVYSIHKKSAPVKTTILVVVLSFLAWSTIILPLSK